MNCENYSVLMSVYIKERPEYLAESIESVLAQTVPTNDFVLVCDGALTAELDEVIEKYTSENPDIFNVLRLPENVGLGKALNKGMEICKNEIIARMDSDDIAMPDRCERQLEKFSENEKLDIVSGTVLEFENSKENVLSKKVLPETDGEIHAYAKKRCPFNHPSVMYKKSAVLKAGGYLDFPLFEDYFLWVRMLDGGSVGYNIPEPILWMRGGADMYKRRGGFSYLKKVFKFRTYMFKNGHIGFAEYIKSLVVRSVVCLMPLKLRMFVYEHMLRKKR